LTGSAGGARRLEASSATSEEALAEVIPIEAGPRRNPPPQLGADPSADRWRREILGTEVRPTKRDYDYFRDLDRSLSQFKRP
jgi:hypothetical protein